MKTRQTIICSCVLLAIAFSAGGSWASDDGGVRSVFARGAGERALGLGGAYGAISGDPTTLYWNPAGLAGLERSSLAAAHTNLIGMGFHEQFGTLAYPSWRLGTFALSLRRYGTDGIEERDDRGTLLSDNLKNSESELTLGYGRALGEAWQVGAAFKLQQQDLAEQSGSGLGLDAGFIVRPGVALGGQSEWVRRTSLGVTFRNIIEPVIRLAHDDVRDPSAIRIGGAVEKSLGSQLDALIALDIEKTKDMDSRLHAGVEVSLLKVLALRVGTNNGRLSAGFGAAWRGLDFQYAFEDNLIEPVHRFGFGLAYGHTVAERRQAALDQREADLTDQIAKAFAEDQKQRVATAVQAVRTALADENYEDALEQVRALEVIDPDSPSLTELKGAAHFGLGRTAEAAGELTASVIAYQDCLSVEPGHEAARTRLASVRVEIENRTQRDERIKGLYRDAMDAFAAGELETARDLFGQGLELAPGDTEMRELAGHVEDAIRMRTDVAEAKAAARTAVEAAEAASTARMVSGTVAVAQDGNSAVGKTKATQVAVPSYSTLPESRRREIANLYEQGVEAAASGRRDDAIRYWELVSASAPDYQQVSAHLKKEYQMRGMEVFAKGKLDRAIEIWEQALAMDPDDPRTQSYLQRVYEQRSRLNKIGSIDQ